MTGSFPKTSAMYILIMPELTLSQVLTYEVESGVVPNFEQTYC